jgi:hypothetical protein
MSRSSRVPALVNGLGLVASALVLASGAIWYPLIEAAFVVTLPLLFAVAVGVWLGAIWPARLALAVGNAAVVTAFLGLLVLYGLARSGEINPIFFFGTALLFGFGYMLIAVGLARGLLARRARPA